MSWITIGDQVHHESLHYRQENLESKMLEGKIVGIQRDKMRPFITDLVSIKVVSYYDDKEYIDLHNISAIILSKRNGFIDNNPGLHYLEGWPYKDGIVNFEIDGENNVFAVHSLELTEGKLHVRLLDIYSIENTAQWSISILENRKRENSIFSGFDDQTLRDKFFKYYIDKRLIDYYKNPYLNERAIVKNPEYLDILLNIHDGQQ